MLRRKSEPLAYGGRGKILILCQSPRAQAEKGQATHCTSPGRSAGGCLPRSLGTAEPVGLLPASTVLPPPPIACYSASAWQHQPHPSSPPLCGGFERAADDQELLLHSLVHPQVDSEEKGGEEAHASFGELAGSAAWLCKDTTGSGPMGVTACHNYYCSFLGLQKGSRLVTTVFSEQQLI